MASDARAQAGMSLDEFLGWPRIDEKPYLEFVPGRIEAKVSPQALHALLEHLIANRLNEVARPGQIGFAFPEIRCTFAGISIVPDVAFLLKEHILLDGKGQPRNEIFFPPDIHVEVRSPGQSSKKLREKLTHSIENGCSLGWLFDPDLKTADVFRPGQPPFRLAADGVLDGSTVLRGYQKPIAEILGGLRIWGDPGAATP